MTIVIDDSFAVISQIYAMLLSREDNKPVKILLGKDARKRVIEEIKVYDLRQLELIQKKSKNERVEKLYGIPIFYDTTVKENEIKVVPI